jgi:hypothetical protein
MNRRWNLLAWTILASVFVGMSIYLLLNPTRTGVVPNYRFAATHWWDGTSMYPGGTHGFLYAPPFAVLFSPLHFLKPDVLGEILWRAFGFGLFASGLHSLAACSLPAVSPSAFRFPNPPAPAGIPSVAERLDRMGGGRSEGANPPAPAGIPSIAERLDRMGGGRSEGANSAFLTLVLLAIPASLASLNNGQTNLPLSACLVLTALALRDQRWKLASLLLTLCLILKPIALAPWLLAFAVLPAMRTPLLIGTPALVLVGFLHPDPSYAWGEWVEFFVKLGHSYTPENLRVSDLFGAIDRAGIQIPPMLEKGIRAAACLGALAWVWQSYRTKGLGGASWALWVAAALVLTIFNPRAETNSYVLISPLLAFAAANDWRHGAGNKWKGIVLAAACIGLMCDGMGLWIYKATDVWFKPMIVLLVSPLLFRMPEGWKGKG